MYTVGITVEVSSPDNGFTLVTTLQPVPAFTLQPGTTGVQWIINTKNPFSQDIATFGSSDGKPGLENSSPLPEGLSFLWTSSSRSEMSVEFHNNVMSSTNNDIHYFINYMFQGRNLHSPDPIIVVTPEPVGSGSVVLEHAQA
jgi:hypothetical protein